MSKKQSISNITISEPIFFVILLAIIILSFLLLVPKVAARLFPFKRQMVWNSFISGAAGSQTISPQSFWEFREFYSPGYYQFDRNGLAPTHILSIETKLGISINQKNIDRVFLTFTSPYLTSIEALTTTNKIGEIINISSLDEKELLLSRNNEIIYKDSNGIVHIVFLKSIDEMKTANGFFDYNDRDQSIVKSKYWLDDTAIQLK